MVKLPIYLDCHATTPVDPEVETEFLRFVREEFGNAGSRTHEFGTRAKQAQSRFILEDALPTDGLTERFSNT